MFQLIKTQCADNIRCRLGYLGDGSGNKSRCTFNDNRQAIEQGLDAIAQYLKGGDHCGGRIDDLLKPAGRGVHHLIQSQVGKEGFEAFGNGYEGGRDIGRQLVQLAVGRQLIEFVTHRRHLSLDVIRPAA
ncbi:hypothetical protein E1189_02385, partial [Sansalvadorimonas verongulae]|nr:hypothetical protein [Sansalvadorimonas verongulae]